MPKEKLTFDERPWGNWEIIDTGLGYQVKRITVSSNKRLSLQSHKYRKEHWVVVSGEAEVEIDSKVTKLLRGESIDMPLASIHRIANNKEIDLVINEIQFGDYLGEDDIIRYEDDFGRA